MGEQVDRRWIILAVFAVAAIVVVLAVVLSRGDDGDSTASAGADGCEEVEKPAPKDVSLEAPKQTIERGEAVTAVVKTSCGSFEIALDTEQAPKTANSFAYLAEEGVYDDLIFHRIAPGFVIQGGDPQGTGLGDAGYSIDEKPPGDLEYTKGTVAMAKSATDPPGRSSSQFFVVTADSSLPPEYAVAGHVSEGMDVVTRIGKLGTPEEKPKQTVLIEEVTIEKE